MDRPTGLATDYSKYGLGFFLLQKLCKCENLHPRCCPGGWKLVLTGGRFTTAAESRYSPVEGECLAVADSLHKARHFVLGCPDLLISVDHKPLLGLLNDRSLADIQNPRLLSLKERHSGLPLQSSTYQEECTADQNICHATAVRQQAKMGPPRKPGSTVSLPSSRQARGSPSTPAHRCTEGPPLSTPGGEQNVRENATGCVLARDI